MLANGGWDLIQHLKGSKGDSNDLENLLVTKPGTLLARET